MRNSRWRLLLVCVAIGFFFNSFNTSAQTLKAVPKGSTSAPLGYYEYLPQGYSPSDSKKWPVIIFLHGVGEVGDGTSQLSIILRTGLPHLLQNGKVLPFVIIMPQANQQWWDPGQVDQMYEYTKTKYNIDQNRFYMTGLSLGGIGSWLYTLAYPQKVAAMVSCAGNSGGHLDVCSMSNVPVWDFHGDADPTVVISGDLAAINALNTTCKVSPRAKMTVYPGVGHNSWDRTYDGSGMGTESRSYDPFNMDIYTWMLQYTKGIAAPVTIQANAGADKTITLPTSSLSITGSGSSSAGSISSYAWTKTGGPGATMSGQNSATLNLSALVQGSYTFQLKITDVAGNTDTDNVVVTVNAAPVTIQANAGADKTITLPTNSLTVTGSGSSSAGSISYAWTKTGGPSATMSGQSSATLSLSALVEGAYTFQLKITDVAGSTDTDNVVVTVNPAPVSTGGLVAEWSLDNNTNDISGNGINGSAVNSPSYTTDRQQGTAAMSLNGSNEYVSINPAKLPTGRTARTISLWAKTNSTATGYRWAFSFGKSSKSNAMFIGQSGTTLYGGGFSDDLTKTNFWQANVWHHICLTYDGTTAVLYADGNVVASAAKTWNLLLGTAAIGRQVNGLEYWNGSLDDVRVYDKALSSTEVKALASAQAVSLPPPTSSLVAEWKLDNSVADATGNGINGTNVNAATYTTDHKEGSAAMNFNGSNQYVDIKNSSALPSGKSPRSMSLWAKTNDVSANYRWAAAYGSPNASQAMFIGQNGTTLYGGGFTDDLTKTNFWQANVWHHLCLTYDGTTAKLYADGTVVASGAKNWNLVLANAFIGRQVNFTEYWNGTVDDVRIYNKALSDSEVAALASSGTASASASASQSVSTSSSLAGEWAFDNSTTDKSGHGHTGALMGGAWYDTYHKEGSASLSLNGNNQYVDLKNPSNFPAGKSARTMSLWARTTDITTSGYRWSASYGSPTQSQAMFIGQKGTALCAGGFNDDLIVSNFWKADTWHHLCLTYDGTTAVLYADGKAVSSAAKNWNLVLQHAYVGRQVSGSEYWAGSVDDVRIYGKALSAAEVLSIYQSNSTISGRTAVTIETINTDSLQVAAPAPPAEEETTPGNNFAIYPNPTQGSISLNINPGVLNDGEAATMIIQDMNGKQVKRIDGITPDSSPNDIEELANGLYVATIVVRGVTVDRQRFIKATR